MEDVCIVCNRAIVWSSEELDANKDTQASASSTRSNGTSSPVSANNRQAASNPGQAKASSSSNNGAPSATSNNGDKQHHPKDKKSLHTHAHHHAVRGHHHARIKRNQSHGKLHTKSGIKPLTSTASSTAIAANAAAISAAVDAIVGTNGECSSLSMSPVSSCYLAFTDACPLPVSPCARFPYTLLLKTDNATQILPGSPIDFRKYHRRKSAWIYRRHKRCYNI